MTADRREINGNNSRTHGYSRIPTYEVCRAIKRRHRDLLPEDWRPGPDAALFYEWVRDNLGDRPSKHHNLVRFIEDFGFIPGNIGWFPLSDDEKRFKRRRNRSRRALYERTVRKECDCPFEVILECPCDYAVTERFPGWEE